MSELETRFVPGPELPRVRRWWHSYPSPTDADLHRLAHLEVQARRAFPDRPAQTDDDAYLRGLLLDARLNPGDCPCTAQRLRGLIELVGRDADAA